VHFTQENAAGVNECAWSANGRARFGMLHRMDIKTIEEVQPDRLLARLQLYLKENRPFVL